MVQLALLGMVAVGGLSVVMTMKSCGIERAPAILVLKVAGLSILFWLPMLAAEVYR